MNVTKAQFQLYKQARLKALTIAQIANLSGLRRTLIAYISDNYEELGRKFTYKEGK